MRASLAACAVAGVVAPLAVYAAPTIGPENETVRGYTLSALAQTLGATVLTLEGGIVGNQPYAHFTPLQLQGALCAPPNTCIPVDYPALPGQMYNELGADELQQAIDALPDDGTPVILFGHSQGGQVIYDVLRRWDADPSDAPDPSQVSWVSIGNPENRYGGRQIKLGQMTPLPADTPYPGTEVIRQYDGWADWPDNQGNLLAVLNAYMGMLTIHPNYLDVNLDDPNNVRYTPALPDGSPGNITYVWVPTPVLPLVAWAGPFAPALDSVLRPIVESAYDRPVPIPAPGSAQSTRAPLSTAATASAPSSTPDAMAEQPVASHTVAAMTTAVGDSAPRTDETVPIESGPSQTTTAATESPASSSEPGVSDPAPSAAAGESPSSRSRGSSREALHGKHARVARSWGRVGRSSAGDATN